MSDTGEVIPLTVTPKEGLFFPPPLDRSIENIIQVKNESKKALTFKVKTTAPQNYHVKPRMRILVAGEACNVKITLRPLSADATPQHKFQIEARYLMPDELERLPNVQPDTLWTPSGPPAPMRLRMSCSFGEQVPSGVQLSFPITHDDSRSEVSYVSEAPTTASGSRTVPAKAEGAKVPTTSAPMSLDAVQREVQHLRQSLTAADSARQTADTRAEKLKADLEASQAECKALQEKYNAVRGGSGIFRKLLNLALLGGVLSLGYEYGLPLVCSAPPECACDVSSTVAPGGSVRIVDVGETVSAATEVPDTETEVPDTETGPGMEPFHP